MLQHRISLLTFLADRISTFYSTPAQLNLYLPSTPDQNQALTGLKCLVTVRWDSDVCVVAGILIDICTPAGSKRIVQAKKEVILSAGAVGSPHILLHSGIGDENELKAVGIEPVANLPSVGKNLTDHPAYLFGVKVNATDTFDE